MISSRKGSVTDILFLAIAAFVISVVIVLCYMLSSVMSARIQSVVPVPAEATAGADTMIGYFPTYIDGGFMFMIITLAIGTLVMAALVRVHPVFIPIYLLGLLVVIFLCGIFSNTYNTLAAMPEFSTYAGNLAFVNYVMTYLPFIVGVFGFILCVVMYKLWSVQPR